MDRYSILGALSFKQLSSYITYSYLKSNFVDDFNVIVILDSLLPFLDRHS